MTKRQKANDKKTDKKKAIKKGKKLGKKQHAKPRKVSKQNDKLKLRKGSKIVSYLKRIPGKRKRVRITYIRKPILAKNRVRKSVKRKTKSSNQKYNKVYKIRWATKRDSDLRKGDYKVIEFYLPDHSFKDKGEAVKQATIPELKYLYERDLPYYPRNIIVYFRIKKPNEPGHFWNAYPAPPDFVPTPANVKKFIAKTLNEYNSNSQDIIAEIYDEPTDPYQVTKISVRYIYIPDDKKGKV